MKTMIPFSGFYGSWHDDNIDRALADIFQSDSGEPNADMVNHVYGFSKLGANQPDFHEVRLQYCREYVKCFAEATGLSLTFSYLDSPKEYNFRTDRIECNISRATVRKLRREVDTVRLDAVAKLRFTSCSGFISHYSPDWRSWGSVDLWDYNQIETLIMATVDDEIDNQIAMIIAENSYEIEEWIHANSSPGFDRLVKIHDYLRNRAQRR